MRRRRRGSERSDGDGLLVNSRRSTTIKILCRNSKEICTLIDNGMKRSRNSGTRRNLLPLLLRLLFDKLLL